MVERGVTSSGCVTDALNFLKNSISIRVWKMLFSIYLKKKKKKKASYLCKAILHVSYCRNSSLESNRDVVLFCAGHRDRFHISIAGDVIARQGNQ